MLHYTNVIYLLHFSTGIQSQLQGEWK